MYDKTHYNKNKNKNNSNNNKKTQKLKPKEDMYLMENKREGHIKKKKICRGAGGGAGTESYFVIFLPGNENLLV